MMTPVRLRMLALLTVMALVLAACGGDDETVETTEAGDVTETTLTTMPEIAQGTGDLALSNGNSYPLAIDGTCDVTETGASFTATSGDVMVTVSAPEGFGTLLMSGGFEAEGRIDELIVTDGNISAYGVVTEADDTASPNDFELVANCG